MNCTAKVNLKYVNLMLGVFDNPKIQLIENKPNGDTFLKLWFHMLVTAVKCNKNGRIELTDNVPFTLEDLTILWHSSLERIKEALDLFERMHMIVLDQGAIIVRNWGRYQNVEAIEKMKKIQESNAERQRRYRESHKKDSMIEKSVSESVDDMELEPTTAEEVENTPEAIETAAKETMPEEVPEAESKAEPPAVSKKEEVKGTDIKPAEKASEVKSSPCSKLSLPTYTTTRRKLTDKETNDLTAALMAYQVSQKTAQSLLDTYGKSVVKDAISYFRTIADKRHITNRSGYLIALIRGGAAKEANQRFVPCTNPDCHNGYVIKNENGHEYAAPCPVCHTKGRILKPSPEQELQFN